MASEPSAPRTAARPSPVRLLLENLCVALVCIAGARLSHDLIVSALSLGPILVEAGIATAAVLVFGARVLPGVALAAFASVHLGIGYGGFLPEADERGSWSAIVALAAAVEAWFARRLVRNELDSGVRIETAGVGLRLMVLVGPCSTWVGAALVLVAHASGAELPADSLTSTFLALWVARTLSVWIFLLPTWAWISNPRGERRASLASVALPVASALVLLIGGYLFVRAIESRQSKREFARMAVAATGDLRLGAAEALENLESLSALLVADPQTNEARYLAFSDQALGNSPSLIELCWVPRVTAEGRAEYERVASLDVGREVRILDLHLDGQMVVAGPRDDYWPERFLWTNAHREKASHADMSVCSDVRSILDQAIRTGSPVSSAPFRRDGRMTLCVYLPVWASKADRDRPKAPDRPFEGLLGFLEATYDADKLVQSSIGPTTAQFLTARLEDHTYLGEAETPRAHVDPTRIETLGWVGEPREHEPAPAFAEITDAEGVPLDRPVLFPCCPRKLAFESHGRVAGRRWFVSMQPTREFWRQHASWSPWLAGVLGLSGAVVLGLYGLMLSGRRGRIEELVTQRTRDLEITVERLTDANVAAQAAARAKGEFLSNISHELRTPLLLILGFSELMTRDRGSEKDRKKWAGTVHESGKRLLSTLNDLLDVARVEAGQLHLELSECSLVEIATESVRAHDRAAQAKGLSLSVAVTNSIPARIETDTGRLRQILMQLVGNAVKFTERGAVRVLLSSIARDRIEIRIIDTGPGIPTEMLERIFEPFTQADGSTSRRHGGAGIGLTLARDLAQLLGGTLRAECEPGIGSSFVLELPVGDAARHGTVSSLEREPSRHALPIAEKLDARVLVAEDNDDTQLLLTAILGRAGADLVLTHDGRAALAAFDAARREGRPFELVLLDVHMPGIDGNEAARALRARGYRGPIMALTAHALASDRDRCFAAGCDDYMTKPFEAHALLATCARLLARSRGKRVAADATHGTLTGD